MKPSLRGGREALVERAIFRCLEAQLKFSLERGPSPSDWSLSIHAENASAARA